MDLWEHIVATCATKVFMEKTVHQFVLLTVKHVEIQTDFALVKRAGWVLIVLQNVFNPMERIAIFRAVFIVST